MSTFKTEAAIHKVTFLTILLAILIQMVHASPIIGPSSSAEGIQVRTAVNHDTIVAAEIILGVVGIIGLLFLMSWIWRKMDCGGTPGPGFI